jgi:hypothetical protein
LYRPFNIILNLMLLFHRFKFNKPSGFSLSKNHLIYGPGKPFSELKHNEVSSTRTGACAISSAALHLAMAISSGSP